MEHIGINCHNFSESLKFYCGVLGLQQQDTVKYHDFSITYLGLPDGSRVEIFDYVQHKERTETAESHIGYRHIAFEVDNLDEWEKHLRKNGVKIKMPATEMAELGVQGLLCEDPDGTVIEICKLLKKSKQY